MADRLLDAVTGGIKIFDLGRPLFQGMPQSPNHPPFRMALQRRHGDAIRPDGGSAANEMFVMGCHVGTHIDALSHVSHEGKLFGGLDAAESQTGGRFAELGIDTVDPWVCRGILLDIPRALGLKTCEAAYEVTASDLDRAAEGITFAEGDVILIRTGWGQKWDEGDAYIGRSTGVPGPSKEGAQWLAARSPRAVGADSIAFEHLPAGAGHAILPAHRVLLVENGIHILETLDLEALATAEVREFTFMLAPLKMVGATGSPVRPIGVISKS